MQTNNGNSALILASENGHLDVVGELMERSAQRTDRKWCSVRHKTNDGYSAIIAASQNGHLDVVRELIGKGAQIRHASK